MYGVEWLVEAFDCSEVVLRDRGALDGLFRAVVRELRLHPVGRPVWHQFPDAGGITGFWLLQESHLAIHTFPEFRSACLNLFCCSARAPWDWPARLGHWLGAGSVCVREQPRGHAAVRTRLPETTHAHD